MDKRVVRKRVDHEEREINSTRAVTHKKRIAYVARPYGNAFTFTFLQVAATHNGPEFVTGEDAAACFDLIADICEPK